MRVSAVQRILMVFAALLGSFLVASSVATTTTAEAAEFSYDVATIARVEAHEFDDAPASTARLDDVREGSASPAVAARGASTTFLTRNLATEAGSAVNVSTDGYSAEDPSAMGRLFG